MQFSESLKNNQQFRFVYKNGRSYANKYFIMYVKENGLDKIRIGSSVAIACALLLAGNITLPIIAIGLSTYAAFTVFRNYKIYRILIVQKAVQENIAVSYTHLRAHET